MSVRRQAPGLVAAPMPICRMSPAACVPELIQLSCSTALDGRLAEYRQFGQEDQRCAQ